MTTRVSVATASSFLSLVIRRTLATVRHMDSLPEDRDSHAAVTTLTANPELAIVDAELLGGEEGTLTVALARRTRPSIVLDSYGRGIPTSLAACPHIYALSGKLKGELDLESIESGLRPLISEARRNRPMTAHDLPVAVPTPPSGPALRPAGTLDLVVVGVSTGGPPLLLQLVGDLRAPAVPLLIVQHMPENHTAGFAARLAEECGRDVVEVGAGPLPPPHVIGVVRGGRDYAVIRRPAGGLSLREVRLPDNPFHPSIDSVLLSAVAADLAVAAAILTGMGQDGAEGAVALAARGLPVVAQRPDTCAVAGMPQAVIDRGAAQRVCGPEGLITTLNTWCAASAQSEDCP